jgi:hypothetical protein
MTQAEQNGKTGSAEAWGKCTPALVEWVFARLVNRRDAWGTYRLDEEIGREYTRPDGTTGRLGAQKTVRGQLTLARLVRHFRPRGRADIIGLHSASADNLAKWGALDIDYHGPESTLPEINLAAALAWYDKLVRRGFRPLLTTSNGKGGYHLRVLLAEAVPAERLYHFLRDLVSDHQQLGLPAPPEHFPKQADVRRCKQQLGNWLRLPGRHHRHEHWSEVFDGSRWLDGAEAVEFILALDGDPAQLVPEPPPASPAQPRKLVLRMKGGGTRPTIATRIASYASRLPHLREGAGRTRVAFAFGAWLVRDLERSDDVAMEWLVQWDAGNSPPLGRDRLAEILADARAYGTSAYGCGLQPAMVQRSRRQRRQVILVAEI